MHIYPMSYFTGDDSQGMTGQELWDSLNSVRQGLEQSYVFILGLAANGPVPCDIVSQYNQARAQLLDLEQQGLDEMQRQNVSAGITTPSALPTLPECSGSETSISLMPATATSTLQGAIGRYQDQQRRYSLAVHRMSNWQPGAAGLGSPLVAVLVVAGIIVVAVVAAVIANAVFAAPARNAVELAKVKAQMLRDLLNSRLTPKQQKDLLDALNGAKGVATSTLAWVAVGLLGGVVLAGVGWYAMGRTSWGRKAKGWLAKATG